MGPLLALVVIGLILIGLVGAIFGGLNLVFQTIFNYFPYFVALVILGYLVTKFGGNRNRMSQAEAGALGAVGGAAASEIADRLGGGGGGDGPDTTPTSPPSSPPSTTGDDSSSSDSGDVDVTVEGDSLSQQQQQQMQQLLTALLQGNLGQGDNGNFVAYGPQQQQQQMLGGLSPGVYSTFMQQINSLRMNQQMLMRQMMQFFMESDYTKIDNQFILQFMKQVLDIDIDEGDVSEGDIFVQINQIVQQINITQIEQNIEKIIQEVNITDITYIEQFMEILIALEEGDYEREGDVTVIFAHQEIRIKAATLLTFLNILQVVKYWELKQMIIELIELSSESWEVKIENLIVIYRESDDGDQDQLNIDLSGTNWEIFLRTLEELEYNQQLKNNLLSIFRDNVNWNQQYGITTATFSSIQNAIGSLPTEDVPKAGQKLIEIVQGNNGNISDGVLREFIDYVYNKWPANRSYLKNENYYQNMANDQVSERLEEIIGQIEEQEKIEKHVIQLDEDAKQALQDALEYYYQEEDFIHAVRVISTDLQDNNIAEITQDINQVNQDLGIDITNPDYAREQIEELRQIAQKLQQAVEDLKEADHELEQVESSDVELEETLEQIEQNEVNMTQQAKTVLQKIHDLS